MIENDTFDCWANCYDIPDNTGLPSLQYMKPKSSVTKVKPITIKIIFEILTVVPLEQTHIEIKSAILTAVSLEHIRDTRCRKREA